MAERDVERDVVADHRKFLGQDAEALADRTDGSA
jgi:hypothetical protein